MSMTKRYLESLPKEQQDDILGLPPGEWGYGEYETVPQIFCKPDEWMESAENEPEDWPEEPGDEQCASILQQASQARLEKPRGHCVREPHPDGSVWDV